MVENKNLLLSKLLLQSNSSLYVAWKRIYKIIFHPNDSQQQALHIHVARANRNAFTKEQAIIISLDSLLSNEIAPAIMLEIGLLDSEREVNLWLLTIKSFEIIIPGVYIYIFKA